MARGEAALFRDRGRVVAFCLAAALVVAGCSDDDPEASTLTQEEADRLAAAVVLEPADIGPTFVDDTASITKQQPLATCLPDDLDVRVLAEAPARSFKTEPDLSSDEPEALDRALGDIESVTIFSAVLESETDAAAALESFGDPSSSPCLQEADLGELTELDSLSVGDESVVYRVGEEAGFVGAFVRSGPVLSYLISLYFDGTTNLQVVETAASAVAAAASSG